MSDPLGGSTWLRRIARVPAWLAVAVLVVSSCALQGEEEAQVISDVQYELLGTSTSTTSTTVAERPIFDVSFFWHSAGDNRLREITRARDEAPGAAQTLRELVAGPLPEDIEANPDLISRLDQSMEPVLTQVDGRTYQIQINWSAEEDLSIEQATEFVCTATQFSTIDAITIVNTEGVAFTLSGVGAVPITGPATPSDFGGCVEEPLPVEASSQAEADGDEAGEDADGSESSTTTGP